MNVLELAEVISCSQYLTSSHNYPVIMALQEKIPKHDALSDGAFSNGAITLIDYSVRYTTVQLPQGTL